jgi:small nuclear ribonucleoprotein (snRNP)-like protein
VKSDSKLRLAVIGVLKGFDQLLNLVLDDVEEDVSGMQTLSEHHPASC